MNGKTIFTALVIAFLFCAGLMAGPLRQDLGPDGIVSVEAEHYDANVEMNGHAFEETGPTGGFTGVLGMHSPNGNGNHTSNWVANSERLEYEIEFNRAGTHYVWIYFDGLSSTDDSLHVGFDGADFRDTDLPILW